MISRPLHGFMIALLAVLHLVLPPAVAMACGVGAVGESCCCVEPPEAVATCCSDPAPSDEAPESRVCDCSLSPDQVPAAPLARTDGERGVLDTPVPESAPGAWLAMTPAVAGRMGARETVPIDRPPLFRLYGVYRL